MDKEEVQPLAQNTDSHGLCSNGKAAIDEDNAQLIQNEAVDVHEAIDRAGCGLGSVFFASVVFILLSFEGAEIIVLSIVGLIIKCEWNLSPFLISLLQMNVLLGMALTSFVSSPFADRFGRKPLLVTSSISMTLFGLLCAHSESYWELFAWRFLVGGSCGLMLSPAATYLAEMSNSTFRAHAVVGVSIAFGIGASITCGLAYLTVERFGWRGYILSNALVFAVTIPLSLIIPESIRFNMVSRRRPDLAIKSLKRLYMLNFKSFPNATLKDEPDTGSDEKEERLSHTEMLRILSQKEHKKNFLIFMCLAFSTIFFYYVSAYATPRFLNEGYCDGKRSTDSEGCTFTKKTLLKLLLISLIEPIGVGIALLLVSTIGRRKAAGLGVVVVFFSCVSLYFCAGPVYLSTTLTIFKGSSAGLTFIPFLMCAEYFPTQIRGLTQSFLVGTGRFGGVVGIFMVQGVFNYNPRVLIGLVHGACFVAGIMFYQLKKETLGMQIK